MTSQKPYLDGETINKMRCAQNEPGYYDESYIFRMGNAFKKTSFYSIVREGDTYFVRRLTRQDIAVPNSRATILVECAANIDDLTTVRVENRTDSVCAVKAYVALNDFTKYADGYVYNYNSARTQHTSYKSFVKQQKTKAFLKDM